MDTIQFQIKDKIGFLGLNRPSKKNALNKQMIEELIYILEKEKDNTSFAVLVLYGEKGIFCSGADLEWMKDGKNQSKKQNTEDALLWVKMYQSLNNFPKPVICEVEKAAFGGAVGLICCSDIVVTPESATFGFPEVKLGLIPATIAPYVVSKMGNSNARKRLLYPEPFSAAEAKEEGLVHYITTDLNLREKTLSIANSINNAAPGALCESKKLIIALQTEIKDASIHEKCVNLIAEARSSDEGQEGVSAFFEKRKPEWGKVLGA